MSKAAKWSVAGVLLGVLIFLLSPSFNNLISNFAFWNAKEQFLYLTGSIAIVYMVMCMLLSVRFSFINNLLKKLLSEEVMNVTFLSAFITLTRLISHTVATVFPSTTTLTAPLLSRRSIVSVDLSPNTTGRE